MMFARALCWPLVCAIAVAQQPDARRIEARVSAVSGASVYIDQGSDDGLEPGDRGRVFASGGQTVEIIVRSIARHSARCDVLVPDAVVNAGDLVEVLVPRERGSADAPSWTHPRENWDPSAPLLAPTRAPTPAERESRFRGRWYTGLDATFDRQGAGREYMLARTGFDGEWENATGRGDVVRFDGEYFHRASDGGQGDETLDRLRVDRASWRLGDWRENSRRMEFGRFLHSELPQLGVIDGGEYVVRTQGGDRFGASAGLLPAWNASLDTLDDVQASVFYRHVGGERGEFSLGGALQKTWHEGREDRDVALADVSWRPDERWWIAGSAWIDLYTAADTSKSEGLELTELHLNARYQIKGEWGLSSALSLVRWPFLLRDELPSASAATIADGEVRRFNLSAWRDVTKDTRLSARLDPWSDQDDSGFGGELKAARRNWLWERGEVWASLFGMDGKTTSVHGLRLGASRWTDAGSIALIYELARSETSLASGPFADLSQHNLRTSWDFALGTDWSCALRADVYFGDEQDATSVGVWLQRRL
ncbi:MAG: hypothetical protein FJ298_13905 [Planctomycetes bacterium]|nr:hypothetical protein [Planctomycetota bacterium]